MNVILTKNDSTEIARILQRELLDSGVDHVMVVDLAGNLVLERGSLKMDDVIALAVLSAANFATTAEIARLLGEKDFTLLFHKGDKRNMHFSRLGNDYLIIALFDDRVSLGLIRLKCNNAAERITAVLSNRQEKTAGSVSSDRNEE